MLNDMISTVNVPEINVVPSDTVAETVEGVSDVSAGKHVHRINFSLMCLMAMLWTSLCKKFKHYPDGLMWLIDRLIDGSGDGWIDWLTVSFHVDYL